MTNKTRELLERTAEILELLFEGPNDVDPNTLTMLGETRLEEIRAYLADTNPSETINSQEVDRSEPTTAAVLPNGVRVTNVHDAYIAGLFEGSELAKARAIEDALEEKNK